VLLFVPEFLSHLVGEHGRELLRGHVVAQPGQDGLEILVGFDAEHVAGSYEGEVYGGVACRFVAVDEEPVLASEADGPDAALDVVVYVVVALLAVAAQPLPTPLRGGVPEGRCGVIAADREVTDPTPAPSP